MTIKDLVNTFAEGLKYEIRNKNNPFLVYWYGRGNSCNIWEPEREVVAIQHTSKMLIIYV